jgi:hypothetical protein
MCVMSVVHDYMREQVPIDNWTRPTWEDFKKLKEQVEDLDRKLGEPDCTDPEKEKYMAQVEARLQALEAENEADKLRRQNTDLQAQLNYTKAEIARLKALHPEPNTLAGGTLLGEKTTSVGTKTWQTGCPGFGDFEKLPNER